MLAASALSVSSRSGATSPRMVSISRIVAESIVILCISLHLRFPMILVAGPFAREPCRALLWEVTAGEFDGWLEHRTVI